MSPQSTPTTSESTPAPGGGETPPGELAQFGPNEWLVDEIYQQYLHDPESVDKAWWDFFNDYQPAATSATGSAPAPA
ncbi:2-oxoglutarate dehydrogenase E1 subunit family protein, partial [Actinospica durhamensis]|uniref:2-oxoglutarate dehydrogenase E1 subunit family protein n=1 Tax=Actinospica durhamensis TaxID=1508375 RepID=UPI0034D4E4E8